MTATRKTFAPPADELARARKLFASAGGHARADKMTKEQRSKAAKHARSFGIGGIYAAIAKPAKPASKRKGGRKAGS